MVKLEYKTEEEAKTKWCPMAINNTCSRNPNGEVPAGAHCVASDCMLWVPIKQISFTGDVTRFGPVTETTEVGGYCGLSKQVYYV